MLSFKILYNKRTYQNYQRVTKWQKMSTFWCGCYDMLAWYFGIEGSVCTIEVIGNEVYSTSTSTAIRKHKFAFFFKQIN